MTGSAVPSDEELREALARWLYLNTAPPSRYPGEGGRVWLAGDVLDLADALLPVVRRWADQRAAEAIRAAAKDLERPRKGWRGLADSISHTDMERATYAHWLRTRADALDGQP